MRKARGFTLVEVVVVLLIFGVVIAMAAVITRSVTLGQKRSITASRLAAVDTALVQYVAVRKRLPCPTDGRLPSTDNNAGLEGARDVNAGCTAQIHGVVPWRLLGLTEQEVTDGWERRITYRVAAPLSADNGMDMSQCDPAGGDNVGVGAAGAKTCAAGCTAANLPACTVPLPFLAGKGFQIRNVAGTIVMDPAVSPPGGAAYVLISHGEGGGGAYLNSGVLSATGAADGDEEKKNYADLVPAAYYVDDSIMETAGAGHYDDMVSRPAILGVVTKAGLGPRSH